MIAWLRGIFFCSLDSVAYRPCGTSSLCFLLIWLSWISVSGHFVALRFAHLQHAFFFNDVSGSSHGESGALCHIAISDGRKSHLSGFLLDLARLRVLLACLKSYPVFCFSCGPVVGSATTFSDSTLCLHGRWNLFYEPRFILSSSFWLMLFGIPLAWWRCPCLF